VLLSGKPLIENHADPEKYPFVKERGVKSLISVPFKSKSRTFGLILVEHKIENAFDEENVRLLSIIGQQVGMTVENAELYQKLTEMANTDGLTGVYNRLYFQQRLAQELKMAEKNYYTVSIAMLDIDHFKKFNDIFGHLFGDEILKKIADLIKVSLRSNDIVARFGGEEFIIMIPGASLMDAYKRVEELRKKISRVTVSDTSVTASVTVSIGVSNYPECALNEADLLSTADSALYDAKASGRDCVKISDTLSDKPIK
jgi:diguanylate cyclase (GGDEF)-like protein